MPSLEAPLVELGSAPRTPSVAASSPSPSEISSASSPEPPHHIRDIRATPLFRALAMRPPEPDQPPGQDELERRLPGYRRIVIPRELTLIELLKQSSGVTTDEEVLRIREAKLRVVAERVGLRRLSVLAPRLHSLTLDGSALSSLRDLGIGLVHLKILSVNRCNLTSLDGVWGLSALRELSASGNRLRDLQPLAALQKLHTLNLSDNPISESDRLWTLGVCGSLRQLTLAGTPASDSPDYRSDVATALPMLVYLDERPLHNDIDYDSEGLFGVLSSESEESDVESNDLASKEREIPPAEPEAGPSSVYLSGTVESAPEANGDGTPLPIQEESDITFTRTSNEGAAMTRSFRRRPATTEGAGLRPTRPDVPARPKTALDRSSIDAPTRLQIMNTLMDEEWRCSGSRLTSQGAVCGNLTHSLRRSTTNYHRRSLEAQQELIQNTLEDATRSLASEIPRAPRVEDWIKFRQETGIDIEIDFNQRQEDSDASKAIERLEQIEKETSERFKQGNGTPHETGIPTYGETSYSRSINFSNMMNDFDDWKLTMTPSRSEPRDVYTLFSDLDDMNILDRSESRFSDNSESRSD